MRDKVLWIFAAAMIGVITVAVVVFIEQAIDLLEPWLVQVRLLVDEIDGVRPTATPTPSPSPSPSPALDPSPTPDLSPTPSTIPSPSPTSRTQPIPVR